MASHFFRAFALAVAIAAVLSVTALTRADVDLWGHLRFGLDILGSGTLESTDTYSFTSDRSWINHEWLSEVAIAGAWLAGGASGLILLKLACILGALGFMGAALTEKGVTGRARIMLLGLTLVGLLTRVTHVRPQLFSVLLFAALIYVFVRSERGSTRTLLWTIPILVLWANFHGGWLVGVGTVGLWCAGAARQWAMGEGRGARGEGRGAMGNGRWAMGEGRGARGNERWAMGDGRGAMGKVRWGMSHFPLPIAHCPLLIAVAAACATVINPYGVGLWVFLIETVRLGREAIVEWGPAWNSWTTLGVWSCFALLTFVAVRRGSTPLTERNPAALVIPVLWGLAALRVNRLDTFFAMSVIGLMATPLASMFTRRASSPALPLAWKAGGCAVAALMVVSVPATRKTFTCIGIHATWPEPDAVDFMRERQMSGRIVTYFDWGEYAIWNMPADLKVSMDGRRETVYSDRTIGGHLQLYRGTERGIAYLDGLHADYVWLPRQLPVVKTLQQRGWRTIFDGHISVLLAASNSGDSATVPVRAGAPAPRCFPGP